MIVKLRDVVRLLVLYATTAVYFMQSRLNVLGDTGPAMLMGPHDGRVSDRVAYCLGFRRWVVVNEPFGSHPFPFLPFSPFPSSPLPSPSPTFTSLP